MPASALQVGQRKRAQPVTKVCRRLKKKQRSTSTEPPQAREWGREQAGFVRRSKRRRGKRLVTSVERERDLSLSLSLPFSVSLSRYESLGQTYADGQFRASLRPLCSAGPRGQRTRLRCFCSPTCTGRSWLSGSAAQKRQQRLNSAAQHLSDARGRAANKGVRGRKRGEKEGKEIKQCRLKHKLKLFLKQLAWRFSIKAMTAELEARVSERRFLKKNNCWMLLPVSFRLEFSGRNKDKARLLVTQG